MSLRLTPFSACLMAGIACLCFGAAHGAAQSQVQGLEVLPGNVVSGSELPDAPTPQQQQPAPAPSGDPGSAASSAQTGAQPDAQTPAQTKKTQEQIAEEQLKAEKKQRIGILPNFNASYITNAVPLTRGQKFRLMFSTEKDPATFGFSMLVALIGQAEGSHPAYGGGIGGYGKRFGQNYADTFDGAFWGNAVLPSLWHQDPRYFRMGTGPVWHRIGYALSTNVRAKHDGTGKW